MVCPSIHHLRCILVTGLYEALWHRSLTFESPNVTHLKVVMWVTLIHLLCSVYQTELTAASPASVVNHKVIQVDFVTLNFNLRMCITHNAPCVPHSTEFDVCSLVTYITLPVFRHFTPEIYSITYRSQLPTAFNSRLSAPFHSRVSGRHKTERQTNGAQSAIQPPIGIAT